MSLSDVTIGDKAPAIVNVIIEIPRGTQQNKYEMDKATGAIKLDRVNYVAMYYPCDYGYVPDTLCDDGDPLDALIVIDQPLPVGAVVSARVIGVMNMVDDGEGDEKLICVPADDISQDHIKSVDDLGPHFKNYIAHYYTHYKDWKNDWKGVPIEINGWGGPDEAHAIVKQSQDKAK